MDFYVYKLEFEKDSQSNLHNNGKPFDLADVRKKWGESLHVHSLPLAIEKAGGKVPAYAPIDAYHDDVALLRVHNIRSVKQWEMLATEPNRLDSFPHCNAIIDNRENSPQVLIEKNDAFGSNPDKAARMLRDYTNCFLLDYGFKINLYPKYRKGDVWDLVEVNRAQGKLVKSVKYKLRNMDQVDYTGVQLSDDRRHYFECLTLAQREYSCAVTEIAHKAAKDSGLNIYKDLGTDFVEILNLVDNNGYDLEVEFWDAPKYIRHKGRSKTAVALYTLLTNDYTNFKISQINTSGSFELLSWLEKIRKSDKASEYADQPLK